MRARRVAGARTVLPAAGRRVMIVGPILMPMSVAWIGQIQFANHTLGWPLAGALVFAAAWELTTAFAGWMYHQARKEGDRGTLFRAATWLFAASAGGMNYWHALGEHSVYTPTPKAVSYGAMSLVGIALWELYASLIHRRRLRDDGKLPVARPRFGLARWLRFPRTTFRAWSLTIRDGLATTGQACAAARDGHTAPTTPTTPAGQAVTREVDPAAIEPVTVPWEHAVTMPPADGWPGGVIEAATQVTSQVTNEATSEGVTQATSQVTPGPLTQATDQATPRATRKARGKTTTKSRRTDAELIAELNGIVADHYRQSPGQEISVKPVAAQLGIGRDRCRRLLDQMSVRPIRRAISE